MSVLTSLLTGLLFGLGLIVSGMADPTKVLGFLDVGGAWDPSLALVMAAAVAVAGVAFGIAKTRSVSLLGTAMKLPEASRIDRRLVAGGAIFGIGWGIGGFCPGPAVVVLGMGEAKAMVFVVAMLAGMAIFEAVERRTQQHSQPASEAL